GRGRRQATLFPYPTLFRSNSRAETGVGGMSKILHRPAAKMRRPIGPALLERVSWDDLRTFAVAGRELSFRKAGSVMRTSSSTVRSEEHTSELQSPDQLVCR